MPGPPRLEDQRRSAVRSAVALGRPRPDRLPLAVVGAGVAMLPLLNPKGPVNTGPVDLLLGAGILMVALWAGTTRAQIHVPYAVPVAGLIVAGLIASLAGSVPVAGVGAVVQEAFLLAWCAAITTICRTPQALRFVVRTWCVSATVWAVVLVLSAASGLTQVPGGKGGYGDRARLWFDHPNLAGNYFVISLFVILATRYPRRPVARACAIAVLLAAMLLAGSNTASVVPAGRRPDHRLPAGPHPEQLRLRPCPRPLPRPGRRRGVDARGPVDLGQRPVDRQLGPALLRRPQLSECRRTRVAVLLLVRTVPREQLHRHRPSVDRARPSRRRGRTS